MFSQKKKRSKGLLFLIPVLLVFLAGLALNAFMSGGSEDIGDGSDAEKDADRLVSAGYDPDNDTDDNAQNGNASGSASSDISEKGSKIRADHEYTDSNGENGGVGMWPYDAESSGDEDEYYYGSDSYSEMYGGDSENSGYSGYRAVSENNMLVIYKYSNGAVVSEERTDIQTDILPEYDREMLENGIDMSSAEDVDELLQDYEG